MAKLSPAWPRGIVRCSILLAWSACGQIYISAPGGGQTATCTMGASCTITLAGSGLSYSSELMVSTDCTSGLSLSWDESAAWDDPLRNTPDTASSGSRFTFQMGQGNWYETPVQGGWYMLCWRRVDGAHEDQMLTEDFDPLSWRHVGNLLLRGPNRTTFTCEVGRACNLQFQGFMPDQGALRVARRGCMFDQYEHRLDLLGMDHVAWPLAPARSCDKTCEWFGRQRNGVWTDLCSQSFAGGMCSRCSECQGVSPGSGSGSSSGNGVALLGNIDFDLGTLPWDATPGAYRMTWCPDASDCGISIPNALVPHFIEAGELVLRCPAGTFQAGYENCATHLGEYRSTYVYDGRHYCLDCPVGFYCLGGEVQSGLDNLPGTFVGHHEGAPASAQPCPEGTTTTARGRARLSECNCAPGRGGYGVCEKCETGRYKGGVSGSSCTACPAGTTTFRAGALSEDECVAEGVSVPAGNTTRTPVVVFDLVFRQTHQSRRARIPPLRFGDVQAYFASVLGTRGSLVGNLSHSVAPEAPERGEYTFRQSVQLLVASGDEQARVLDVFDEIIAPLAANLGIRGHAEGFFVTQYMQITWTPPTAGVTTVACAEQGRAVIPGVLITEPSDREACQCMPGFGDDTGTGLGTCQECPVGQYKPAVGNSPCTPCSAGRTTSREGSTSADECVCPAGTYFNFRGECVPCETGYYCDNGRERQRCPSSSTTFSEGARSADECFCGPGYYRESAALCSPCEAGKYKQSVGNARCDEVCPSGATTQPGATSRDQCHCLEGFHARLEARNLSLVSCLPCNYEGLVCKGGFNYASGGRTVHAQPVAAEGFFQTGADIAVRCGVFDDNGGSVCLGGDNWCLDLRLGWPAEPDCHGSWGNKCSEHASGMLCGNCPSGTARDGPLESCGECSSSAALLALLSSAAELSAQGVVSLTLAAAAAASQSKQAQSLHSALLRIGSQWFAACSVVTQFDLSRIPSFGWAQTAANMEWRQENCEDSDCGTGPLALFDWPEEASRALDTIFWMVGFVPTFGNLEQNLACAVESSGAQAKRVAPAMYMLAYPLLLMLMCTVLAAILVYWVLPFMKRLGLPTGSQLSDSSRLAFVQAVCSKSRARLEPRLNAYGLKWKDFHDVFLPRLVASSEGELLDMLLGGGAPEDAIDATVLRVFLLRVRPSLQPAMKDLGIDWPTTRALVLRRIPTASALMEKKGEVQDTASFAQALAREHADLSEEDRGGLLLQRAGTAGTGLGEVGVAAHGRYLGLFTPRPGPLTLLGELAPVFWVALHTIWPWLLTHFLQMLWCEPTPQGAADGRLEVKQRLVSHPDIVCGSAEHMPLTIIAGLGLLLWIVGIPMALFVRIWALGRDRQHPDNARHFGYYFFGYEPHAWWWDIIVKRVDVGLMMCVAYTSIADDAKARLLLFPVISGLFLFITAWFRPFDSRWSGLMNLTETLSLAVRFLLFSVIAVLLIFNTSVAVTTAFALAVTFLLLCFVAFLVLQIVVQIARRGDDDGEEEGEDEEEEEDESGEGSDAGGCCSIYTRKLESCIKCLFAGICGACLHCLSRALQPSRAERLRVTWTGGAAGGLRVGLPPSKSTLRAASGARRVHACLVLKSRSRQREAISGAMGAFGHLWIDYFREEDVPAVLDSIAFVLAAAFKSISVRTLPDEVPRQVILRSKFIVAHMEEEALSAEDLVGMTIRLGHMKGEDARHVVQELNDLVVKKLLAPAPSSASAAHNDASAARGDAPAARGDAPGGAPPPPPRRRPVTPPPEDGNSVERLLEEGDLAPQEANSAEGVPEEGGTPSGARPSPGPTDETDSDGPKI